MSTRRRPRAKPDTPGADSITSELPDVLQFMRLLWAMAHALQKTSKRMNAELGVTGPQRLVLRVVGLFPGASAGTLSNILHVHPSTLTGVLRRLGDQRLLIRAAHPSDRRRAVLNLTPRGARVNAVSRGTVEVRVGRALKGVSARDRKITRLVLAALTRRLDESPPSAPHPAAGGRRV